MHHDHLTELAKAMFRAACDQDPPDEIRKRRARARSVAASLIERFAPTLIFGDAPRFETVMESVAALQQRLNARFSIRLKPINLRHHVISEGLPARD